MRQLPIILSAQGRWVLPVADRSAALLAEMLLADQHAELSTTLADILRVDPPLALWTVVTAVERDKLYPATVAEIAAWLSTQLIDVLQWPQPAPGSPPSPVSPSSQPFADFVRESLCLAATAAQLASELSSPDRERAYLAGLVHNAPAWFRQTAIGDAAAMPEPFSRWLSALAADAAGWAASAAASLAGDTPAPAFDASSVRRHSEQETQAWEASLPGAGGHLPALTARLARLEQLEHRFCETLEYEKLEAMAELAAGAGHEINNPLAIIAGRAQLFLQDETDPERRREAAIIVAQVKRAHEMIADMRLFARPPRPEPQPFDLVPLVDRVLSEAASHAAERATSLERSGHPGPLPVQLDPTQVGIALAALIRNALEAIGQDGRIEVALEGDDDSVAIRVSDNGPGIPPEQRSHIFDPFYSARQAGRGLGMGLSKAWRIVTNHGGRIDVESQAGQGAVFAIRLPRRIDR